MVPFCCVGCKHAFNNECQKKNWCFAFRVIHFFAPKYWVPNKNWRYKKKDEDAFDLPYNLSFDELWARLKNEYPDVIIKAEELAKKNSQRGR